MSITDLPLAAAGFPCERIALQDVAPRTVRGTRWKAPCQARRWGLMKVAKRSRLACCMAWTGRQVALCTGLILSRVQGDAVPERHGTQGSQQGQARHLRFHVLMLIAFHDLTFGLLD